MHLLYVGIDRAVQVAGVFHHLAAQGFTLLFDLAQARVRLTHLRAGQTAAVQRDIQLQADAALRHVAAVTLVQGIRVAQAKAVVVASLVLRHCIQGRCMSGLALLEGFFGGTHGEIAGQQIEVLLRRCVDPRFGVIGRRWQNRQGVGDAFNRRVLAIGQGHQRLEGIFNLALSQKAIGACGVVAGLGLQYVGFVR